MFQPSTLHTDFARQLQADRAAIGVERRSGRSVLARGAGRLVRRPAAVERPAHATA